jgi:hypothetical protein
MPLQNRVTPFGAIIAVPQRGTLMGNRGGRIHTPDKALTRRRWASRRWIACVLEFRGRRREVMAPDRYTELFFLDEATALAAGHRPCRECRRADHERFREAWLRGNAALGLPPDVSVDKIDRVLHAERVGPGGAKVTFACRPDDLPDGVFVARGDAALLVAGGALWEWSPGGYAGPLPLHRAAEAAVLTPRSIVRAIQSGYTPTVHPSARTGRRACP